MEKFRLTHNLGLKIISLVFACVLWFLVTNLSDPVVSITLNNIPVQLQNTAAITSRGEIYEVLDGTDMINTVTVYAPRSVVDTLSGANIIATADLSELSSLDTASIELRTNKYSDRIESIGGSHDTVKLNIEERRSKILPIEAYVVGTAPDGYQVSGISTEQNQLRISGPASVIENVAQAMVEVDVTGFTADIGTDATIRLYDEAGDEIDRASIIKNISTVRANITILQTKWLDVNIIATGTPAEGYAVAGTIACTPERVLVAGRQSALANMTSLDVTDSAVDVSNLTADLNVPVNLRTHLPGGMSFADVDFNGYVSVVVNIERVPGAGGETTEEGEESEGAEGETASENGA
ncbi:MAG: hypothetical protein IJR58_02005 [Lachnospiraceae bacterium]|nr:hypothetical protein [Lachnospiraceae bacterium]